MKFEKAEICDGGMNGMEIFQGYHIQCILISIIDLYLTFMHSFDVYNEQIHL